MLMSGNDDNEMQQPVAQSPTERAEEALARLEQRVGPWASNVRLRVLRLAARAREEAEDMWAEAQAIRQENARKSE